MELKLLFSGFLFMFFTLSCIEPVIDTSPVNQVKPVNAKLKSAGLRANYYVAKNGSDSNTGTLESPFLTITKGLSVAVGGDAVYVKAGTYQEYVRLFNSGSSGNPIVLSNYGTDIVTIDAANKNVYCIYSKGQSFLSVKGIRCKDATSYIIKFEDCNDITLDACYATMTTKSETVECIVIDNNTRHNNYLIKNCIGTNGARGIALWNNVSYATVQGGEYSYNLVNIAVGGKYPLDLPSIPKNIIIDGAYAHNSTTSNIGTENCQYVTIKNCHTNMGGASGIQIETHSYDAIVEDNLCENNSRAFEYETGIWIYDSENAIVRRNYVKNNQTGLRFRNATNFTANNNIVENNNYKPSSSPNTHNTSGADFSQSSGTFYNNTLIGNCAAGSSLSSIYVYPTGISNVTIKNNIIVNDGSSQDMAFEQSAISDYNLVYNANRAVNILIGGMGYSWTTYKTVRGQDTHSINTNPLFVSSTDYKLQSTSSAINAGVNVGLTSDYLKNALVGPPDIGANEYIGSNPPPAFYYNSQITAVATKNDCGPGYTGTTVTYTVPAKKYSSSISQVDADNKALEDLNVNKQANANANGTCTIASQTTSQAGPPYFNTQISVSVTKNDCGTGYTGSTIIYTVEAKKYSSTQTQLRADNKALDDLNMNKQAYANANGTCIPIAQTGPPYYNTKISATATKNDCGTGFIGTVVTYTIEAKKYSSTQTQLRADTKALDDLNMNKQAYANANGSCTKLN